MDTFMLASGAMINQRKSYIFFFNIPLNIQCNVTRILGFQKGSLPSKYISAHLMENFLRNASWEYILSKIDTKVNSWTFIILILSRNINLIKLVLQSIPLYLSLILVSPSKIFKSIQFIQREFL
jgi:hypothetical protein